MLHCCTAAFSWGRDYTECTKADHGPFRPVALLSHVPTAEALLLLCGLYRSLLLLLLMVQGRHLSEAAVWVIRSDSAARSCSLSSRHLPRKSLRSLLVCDRCQALEHRQCPSLWSSHATPRSPERGRFNGAHCQKCTYGWVVNKCIPRYLAIFQTCPVLVADCLTTVLSFYSSPGNTLELWLLLLF